jgi:hypothetical protein
MTTTASSHPASPTNSPASSIGNSSPEYLILPGAPGTGKTGALSRLTASFLIGKKGFIHVPIPSPANPYPYPPVKPGADFLALFERQPMPPDKQWRLIRIVMNTGMDAPRCADILRDFINQCGQLGKTPDIIITAGRDANFHPSPHFWKTMEISPANLNVLQVPLAKITRRGHDHSTALTWYQQRTDALLEHILSNAPFNI